MHKIPLETVYVMHFPFRLSTKTFFVDSFKLSHERRIPMAQTNLIWGTPVSLITYDLSNNDVSAQQIAEKSNGKLSTTVSLSNDPHKYLLPNTTLCFNGSRNDAETIFRNAFNQAKNYYSSCRINRLLITEVKSMNAFVED